MPMKEDLSESLGAGPGAVIRKVAERSPNAGSPMRLVLFALDGQRYGLPLARVERALPMVAVAPLPKAPAIALGVINLHGQVIPVLDVGRRLGFFFGAGGVNAPPPRGPAGPRGG